MFALRKNHATTAKSKLLAVLAKPYTAGYIQQFVCGSMVDIQSANAENRQGKKKEEETTAAKCNGLPYRAVVTSNKGYWATRGYANSRIANSRTG